MRELTNDELKVKLYDQQTYIKHLEKAYKESVHQLALATERADHFEELNRRTTLAAEAWKEKAESIEFEFDQWQEKVSRSAMRPVEERLANSIAELLERHGFDL